MTVTAGASATDSYTVTDQDTAIVLGSGDVPVLATPRMIAWCEAMTVRAVADQLETEQTTVGFKIGIDHLAPTLVGATVDVSATISEVDRSQVTFAVNVKDTEKTVARGTITRVIVDRTTFLERATNP